MANLVTIELKLSSTGTRGLLLANDFDGKSQNSKHKTISTPEIFPSAVTTTDTDFKLLVVNVTTATTNRYHHSSALYGPIIMTFEDDQCSL